MTENIARFEEKLSEDATTFLLQSNEGFVGFDNNEVFLFRTEKSEEGLTLKTAPRERVELCQITESEPDMEKYSSDPNAENTSNEVTTEIIFYLRNKSFREKVSEKPDTVAERWLESQM